MGWGRKAETKGKVKGHLVSLPGMETPLLHILGFLLPLEMKNGPECQTRDSKVQSHDGQRSTILRNGFS